jgi:putative heme-binding domain-containing protein
MARAGVFMLNRIRDLPCLAVAAALSMCAQTPPPVANPRTSPADIAAGRKMFRSHCAPCHGPAGEGGLGPTLASGVYYHGSTDEDLLNNISNGIPGTAMPATYFDPNQVWQLVAFVRSLSRSTATTPPPGDPMHGAALFRENGCSGCHRVRGDGDDSGGLGPDLTSVGSERSVAFLRQSILDPSAFIPAQYRTVHIALENGSTYSGLLLNEDTWSIQIRDSAKGLLSIDRHAVSKFEFDKSSPMPAYRDKLTASQVNDLVAWLYTLKRRGGSE